MMFKLFSLTRVTLESRESAGEKDIRGVIIAFDCDGALACDDVVVSAL